MFFSLTTVVLINLKLPFLYFILTNYLLVSMPVVTFQQPKYSHKQLISYENIYLVSNSFWIFGLDVVSTEGVDKRRKICIKNAYLSRILGYYPQIADKSNRVLII